MIYMPLGSVFREVSMSAVWPNAFPSIVYTGKLLADGVFCKGDVMPVVTGFKTPSRPSAV